MPFYLVPSPLDHQAQRRVRVFLAPNREVTGLVAISLALAATEHENRKSECMPRAELTQFYTCSVTAQRGYYRSRPVETGSRCLYDYRASGEDLSTSSSSDRPEAAEIAHQSRHGASMGCPTSPARLTPVAPRKSERNTHPGIHGKILSMDKYRAVYVHVNHCRKHATSPGTLLQSEGVDRILSGV